MKKLFSFLTAMLILTGIKAQQTTLQKETIKPATDTLVPNLNQAILPVTNLPDKTYKDHKLVPALKPTVTELKNAPDIKDIKRVSIKR